jgi:hypothetical protein
MAAFHLSKWYLDCVDERGDVTIVYTGMARWGAFRLNYSGLLESAGDHVTTRQSLRAAAQPNLIGDSLAWRSDAMDVGGEWKADAAALRARVFASDAGSIEWHCIMPRAHARAGATEGLGYAECLTMTVAPWKLPLRTLRWGRFGSASDWVVWIDWRGNDSRTFVYRNGRETEVVSLTDERLDFADGSHLAMDRSLVIRDGPLGTSALSAIPGIRDSVPARLLRVYECKWRSRARFERPGRRPVDGWAIHEKVEWPE